MDASFVAKLLIDEQDSDTVTAYIDASLARGDSLVSSRIIVTELHRLGFRENVPRLHVNAVLGVLTIVNPDSDIFMTAGLLAHHVKTLDAIHIATATKVEADIFLTFDMQQANVARLQGLVTGSVEEYQHTFPGCDS